MKIIKTTVIVLGASLLQVAGVAAQEQNGNAPEQRAQPEGMQQQKRQQDTPQQDMQQRQRQQQGTQKATPTQQSQPTAKKHSRQAKQADRSHEISGKVEQSRQARVETAQGTQQNRVVLLRTEEGRKIAVDLGPDAKLADVQIKEGTPIKATGSVVSIDGKPVFLVRSVKVGDRAVQVQRGQPASDKAPTAKRFSGTIGEMREMRVKDADTSHRVVVLTSDEQDRKMLVDLGPQKDLAKLDLSKGDEIAGQGIAMNIGGRRVLVAQELRKGDEHVAIDREALPTMKKKGAANQR